MTTTDDTLYFVRPETRTIMAESIEALALDFYATRMSEVRMYTKEQLAKDAQELVGRILALAERDMEITREYFSEWRIIDNLHQHKDGLNLHEYFAKREQEIVQKQNEKPITIIED